MANSHNHSPWRKSVLIPFWTVQLLFMLIYIALLGLALGVVVSYDNSSEFDNYGAEFDQINNSDRVVKDVTDIVVPIWITLCVICLVLTITEIILLARHRLRPLAFLIMNVIKTVIWTALFILDIISAASAGGRTTSIVGIIIDAIILLSFLIPLVYGSIIYHRLRKEGKTYKPVDPLLSTPLDTYDSQLPTYVPPHTAHNDIEGGYFNPPQPDVAGRARSVSWNHERDTRYEAYRKSCSSPENKAMATSESQGLVDGSYDIPQVYVEQHHDGEGIEMNSRSELR